MPEQCSPTPAGKHGTKTEVACEECGLFGFLRLLTVIDPQGERSEPLAGVLSRRTRIPKGETLYRHGQQLQAVFAVKSGAFKSYTLLDTGEEQVTSFHFPGELIGLDALKGNRHQYTVKALEDSSVCQLQFRELERSGVRLAEFREQMIKAMSEKIGEQSRLLLVSSRPSAEERLAAFVLNVSRRLEVRGFPSEAFRLAMSRQDIASYLGLAVETVSRMFKRFQAEGLLSVSGKQLRILNRTALQLLAKVRD
jgi:CRP/FNR family transcriptional regulator